MQKFQIGTPTFRKSRGRGIMEATGGEQYTSLPEWPLLILPRIACLEKFEKGKKGQKILK